MEDTNSRWALWPTEPYVFCMKGLGLNDFAAAQAGRADADPLALARNLGMHRT